MLEPVKRRTSAASGHLGGSRTPLPSGYRSSACLGDDEELWGVEIAFDAPAMLAPGQTAVVSLMAWARPADAERGDDDPGV
jgi:hypothetical protein